MSYRVVHYINQFFAQIGGEEMAHIAPELREGFVGPGMALNQAWKGEAEIVKTIVCGDSYFAEHEKDAKAQILEWVKAEKPDLFIAGPAFNAGRYGYACANICAAVKEELGIPVLTGMYEENPGADMFKKDVILVKTGNSAATMRKVVPQFVSLINKMAKGEEILGPAIEGYHERGIRMNYFAEERGATRGMKMLLKKMAGEPFETDLPMPKFDRVPIAEPVKDIKTAKIAIVTSSGVVPQGNPDRIESSNATRFGYYSIEGMDRLDKKDFFTVHGGYDRQFVLENPNLAVPIDAMRNLEKAGEFGELVNYFAGTDKLNGAG